MDGPIAWTDTPPRSLTTRARVLSAATGSGISAIVAILLLLIASALPNSSADIRGPLLFGSAGAGVGVIVGWYLGWTRAEDALSARRPRDAVLDVSWRAIVIGAALVALTLTVGSATWSTDLTALTFDRVASAVLYPLLGAIYFSALAFVSGLLIFGAPALLLTVPIVAIWRSSVRRLLNSDRRAA